MYRIEYITNKIICGDCLEVMKEMPDECVDLIVTDTPYGYDQFGINIPTKFIGGDYYDCIPLEDGRYVFIMADVSGKGIAASLLVSTLHASAHAYFDGPFDLESTVKKLNEVVFDATPIDRYITAVFSVLDPVYPLNYLPKY